MVSLMQKFYRSTVHPFPGIQYTHANQQPTSRTKLSHRLLHRLDDALLDHNARLGRRLESLLCRPFRTDRDTERSLVLLLRLEGVRELIGQVLVILWKINALVYDNDTVNSNKRVD